LVNIFIAIEKSKKMSEWFTEKNEKAKLLHFCLIGNKKIKKLSKYFFHGMTASHETNKEGIFRQKILATLP